MIGWRRARRRRGGPQAQTEAATTVEAEPEAEAEAEADPEAEAEPEASPVKPGGEDEATEPVAGRDALAIAGDPERVHVAVVVTVLVATAAIVAVLLLAAGHVV